MLLESARGGGFLLLQVLLHTLALRLGPPGRESWPVGAVAFAEWVEPVARTPPPLRNPLLEKLRNDQPLFGGFVTIPHYQTVENLAAPGFLDFIWIEAEHGQWGSVAAQRLVAACESKGVSPVVRVPRGEVDVVKKYVGSGAWGFVIPNLRTVDDARTALGTTKYPPTGTRRAGAERANDYLMRFVEYIKVANSQMLMVLMMETPEAVDSIEEWVKLPGLDIVHFGPYDLSLRLNVSLDSPVLAQKIAHVESVCQAAGVAMGGAVSSLAEAREKYARGYRFFTVPGDMQLLQGGISAFFKSSSDRNLAHTAHNFFVKDKISNPVVEKKVEVEVTSQGTELETYTPKARPPPPLRNPLLEKLRNDQPLFGGFVTIPHYQTVENLAAPGFLDFIWIEAEHGQWGSVAAQRLVAACESKGVSPVVRVPRGEVDVVKKYVGSGAWGFVIPNLRTVDDARTALGTTKYPPTGTRRAGAERANDYLMRFVEYIKVANSQMLMVLMMETPEAVDSIEEWVKLPGLDIVHFGPYDLSLRLNVSLDSPVLAQKIAHVESVCQAAGVAMGGAVSSLAEAREKYARGYRFFTVPGDMQLLQGGISAFFADPPTFIIKRRPQRQHGSSSLGAGTIAAIVIGSVVTLICCTAVALVVYRRKLKSGERQQATQIESSSVVSESNFHLMSSQGDDKEMMVG